MRISLVFGAGATLANAKYFRPVRSASTHPPLDYTFFEKIAERGIDVPVELRDYAADLPSGSPFESAPGTSRMEEFLRDLFHDFLQERSSNASVVRAYRQLIGIYMRVIRETTDWMLEDGHRGGPVGRLLAAAAEKADRVDVITFNHDLVIENEIAKRARLSARWCLDEAYGDFGRASTLLGQSGVKQFSEHSDDCDHARPIVLHKLHGSLNWFVRIRAREPSPGTLTGDVSDPDILISRRRSITGDLRVRMRTSGRGRQTWNLWPVVVPPVYAKQSLIQAFMPSVWREAREALSRSDRVVFFGYSLPLADIEAEKMFQRTLVRNTGLHWVGLIDPSISAPSRYAGILPRTPLRRFPDADSFLGDEAFD